MALICHGQIPALMLSPHTITMYIKVLFCWAVQFKGKSDHTFILALASESCDYNRVHRLSKFVAMSMSKWSKLECSHQVNLTVACRSSVS